jgi:Tfp pilus assembly protein PilF/predicted small integral membrane protein
MAFRIPRRPRGADATALRRVVAGLPGKLPFLVCMAAMMWVSWVSQASSAARLLVPNVSSAEVLARLAGLICYNLMLYVGNIFWPMHLSPYRDLPADLSLTSPAIAASVVATLAFLTICVLAYRRSRPLFVGGIAFLILLAPALGAVRFVETCVADRFLYLPSVLLTLPLAALLVRMEGFLRRRTTILCVGIALLAVLLTALTWKQQAVWHDSRALWTHIVRTAPNLPKGHAQLAAVDLESGDFDTALVHARRAIELAPDEAGYLHVLGRALVRTGHAADAVPVLRKAIVSGLGPVEPLAHLSLAEALLVAGDATTARAECARAIAMGRGTSSTYMMMGDAAMQLARNYAAAAEYFALALDHEPANLTLRWNYGTALQYCGRDAEALREYQQVIAAYRQRGLPTDQLDSAAAALRERLKSRGP